MKKLCVLLCLACLLGSAWAETTNQKTDIPHEVKEGSIWTIDLTTDKVTLKKPLPKNVYQRKGHLHLADGRVCKGCTVYKNMDVPDELGIIVDSHGKWYRSYGFPLIGVDEHPYARAYAMGATMATQQFNMQMQQQNYVNQMKPAKNWNCNSFGNGTSCYSY